MQAAVTKSEPRNSIVRVMTMNICRKCKTPIAFAAGLITAAILPTKAVCVIAAIVLVCTCLSLRR